jgi:hypothetical protein
MASTTQQASPSRVPSPLRKSKPDKAAACARSGLRGAERDFGLNGFLGRFLWNQKSTLASGGDGGSLLQGCDTRSHFKTTSGFY